MMLLLLPVGGLFLYLYQHLETVYESSMKK